MRKSSLNCQKIQRLRGTIALNGQRVPSQQDRVKMIRQAVNEAVRGSVLNLIKELFDEEVEALCGEKNCRKGDQYLHRGGSEKHSRVLLEGQQVQVSRPRVRNGDGEEPLEAYSALQNYDLLTDDVKRLLIRGVSTRNYEDAIKEIDGGLGLKRTQVSKVFTKGSQKDLETINGRDLSKDQWASIFMDGIEFAGLLLIVALGVTYEGKKVILGIVEGSTESEMLCLELLRAIENRGFKLGKDQKILAVLDGGKGLHAAVKKMWYGQIEIQRCLEHKGRNVIDKVSKSMQAEVKRRLKAAWGLNDYEPAKTELKKVEKWLEGISQEAANSLREGQEETLTLHRLNIPPSLRVTFSTTNPIESPFSTVRERTHRVKNWRKGKDQARRWVASSLLLVEKNFNKIKGYKRIGELIEALKIKEIQKVEL